MASLAARLAQVEQCNRQLKEQVANQSQELEALRSITANRAGDLPESSLLAERDRLRRRVEALEAVLREHGLSMRQDGSGEAADSPADGELSLDIKVLATRVEELNDLMEEERARVVTDNGCARIASDDVRTLPVTFFADGLKLADRAFLRFESTGAQTVIKELLARQWPSVLVEERGANLRVVNRTSAEFLRWMRHSSQDDPDLCDGGERLRLSVGVAVRAPANAQTPQERLLAKLPEKVVRNGRICPVRGPVAESLGTVAPALQKGEVALLNAGRAPDAPVAKLQVRLESGKLTLLMEPSATIRDVMAVLAKRGVTGQVLRSAFPPCAYTELAQTLEAAGFVPSITLFLGAAG